VGVLYFWPAPIDCRLFYVVGPSCREPISLKNVTVQVRSGNALRWSMQSGRMNLSLHEYDPKRWRISNKGMWKVGGVWWVQK